MRAVVMTGYGGAEKIELRRVPVPQIGDEEVLVEVHAASLNPVDGKISQGQMKALLRYRFPQVMGNDLAGRVVATGSRVHSFKAGDEVYARVDKRRLGAFADFAAVSQTDLALKPKNLSTEEAAAVPLVGLTVFQALREISRVSAGQKVFIKAGSGGIGTFAIPFAKALGAEVATTTSSANIAWVRALGADHVIDYKTERFEELLHDYDVVLDSVDGDNVARGFSILKRGGHLVSLIGPPDRAFARAFGLNPLAQWACAWLSRKETRLAKKTGVGYSFLFVEGSGAKLGEIASYIERNDTRPVIDRFFDLEQIHDALAYAARGRTRGKVVIKLR